MYSCKRKTKVSSQSTYTSGTSNILVDETFEPILDGALYVFKSAYPKANLIPIYKPEKELMKIFLNDSVRVAILSRELTKNEASYYENKSIKIRVNRFAIDGIALITSKSNIDSTASVEDIVGVLKGKPLNIKSLIFDNPNSSTVRYLMELAGVSQLPKNGVYALKSNSEVISYVYNNPGAIGVVGVNWMDQPSVSQEEMVKELKILAVKDLPGKAGSNQYYLPNQNDIALGLYPLTRSLYIINCEGGGGLGTGFASFIAGERGQRIVLKSGLLPNTIPAREINIIK